MALHDEVAAHLRRQRELRQISQQELAALLGVAPNTVSRWETGASRPGFDDLERVAATLGINVGEFFPHKTADAEATSQRLIEIIRGLPAEDLKEIERFAEFRRLLRRSDTA